MDIPRASAAKVLHKELKRLTDEPLEGFQIIKVDDTDLYEWIVAIFGPPGTLYEGGYFKAVLRFPGDYPFSPPTFRFISRVWHPNIYENGEVCISILHPPANIATGGELPEERWNPTQSVRTVVMSIVSLLNEPNTFSPANVDASIMFRDYKESKSTRYKDLILKCVAETRKEAEKDGVDIPTSEAEYCSTGRTRLKPASAQSKSSEKSNSSFNLYEEYSFESCSFSPPGSCGENSSNVSKVSSRESIPQQISSESIPEQIIADG